MSSVDIFVIAAEPSADLLGAHLVEALLKQSPNLHISAVAGPRMRKLPIQSLYPMENLQVMGFIDVLKAFPKILKQYFAILNTILHLKPKAIITIDYPGFNLRLHRSLRKKGFTGKQIHYVCPTVWAWGKKRIPLMEKNLDLLLTLFPFESKCFDSNKLNVQHIGHPLTQTISSRETMRKNLLAIFPGSRSAEIEKNLTIQLAVAKHLKAQDPSIEVAISVANASKQSLIEKYIGQFPTTLIPADENYILMRQAKMALATSGTVTLELALHETPTLVNYAIRPFDLFLARQIFRINLPFYCLVNIIANRQIFPEFFGPNLTMENLRREASILWHDKNRYDQCRQNCKQIRLILGEKNASEEAASNILSLITSIMGLSP